MQREVAKARLVRLSDLIGDRIVDRPVSPTRRPQAVAADALAEQPLAGVPRALDDKWRAAVVGEYSTEGEQQCGRRGQSDGSAAPDVARKRRADHGGRRDHECPREPVAEPLMLVRGQRQDATEQIQDRQHVEQAGDVAQDRGLPGDAPTLQVRHPQAGETLSERGAE